MVSTSHKLSTKILKLSLYFFSIGELFAGTIGLASHRDRVHSQKVPCPTCHKLLPSKIKLEYHMISHMAPEEKKYCCEKCGKKFGWSHHLAKHEMNVHVRSRPYKCSVPGCNWAFNDLSNRNMHERRVHKKGPPPKRWNYTTHCCNILNSIIHAGTLICLRSKRAFSNRRKEGTYLELFFTYNENKKILRNKVKMQRPR